MKRALVIGIIFVVGYGLLGAKSPEEAIGKCLAALVIYGVILAIPPLRRRIVGGPKLDPISGLPED